MMLRKEPEAEAVNATQVTVSNRSFAITVPISNSAFRIIFHFMVQSTYQQRGTMSLRGRRVLFAVAARCVASVFFFSHTFSRRTAKPYKFHVGSR